MRHMRKALSLLLVLAMVVCFAVPAMAASPADATVTVYVTTGMFTKGGINGTTGAQIPQAFSGGDPASHLLTGYTKVTLDIEDITSEQLTTYRGKYNAPTTLSTDVNVLDAVVAALSIRGFTCAGGWDSYSTPNGGYISSVSPNGIPENHVGTATINGVNYTKYYGTGWNLAFTQYNEETEAFEYVVPKYYGTRYIVEDGMTIVFDLSAYELYYPAN